MAYSGFFGTSGTGRSRPGPAVTPPEDPNARGDAYLDKQIAQNDARIAELSGAGATGATTGSTGGSFRSGNTIDGKTGKVAPATSRQNIPNMFGGKTFSGDFTPSSRSPLKANAPYSMDGGGGDRKGYGDMSYLTPTMARPEMGDLPEYNLPEIDEGRISSLTERGMGTALGRLDRGFNRGLVEARYSTNANVRDMSRRNLMQGRGEGIANIRTGAQNNAMAQYMPEFQAKVNKSGAEYQAGVNRVNNQFQADTNNYISSQAKISSSGQRVPPPGQSYLTPQTGNPFSKGPRSTMPLINPRSRYGY